MSGGGLPPSDALSVGPRQPYLGQDGVNHFQTSQSHGGFVQPEKKGISQGGQYTPVVNNQTQNFPEGMNPAAQGHHGQFQGHWPTPNPPSSQGNLQNNSPTVNNTQTISTPTMNHLGHSSTSTPPRRSPTGQNPSKAIRSPYLNQPPMTNSLSNGPVAASGSMGGVGPMSTQGESPQGQPSMPMVPNGPFSMPGSQPQPPFNTPSPPVSSGSIQHAGSAFTPVPPHHPQQSHPLQHSSSTPPLPGQLTPHYPNQGVSSSQAPLVQTSYPGQPQGSPGQSAVSQPPHSLSALHSNKPKRPVMPMNQGVPYPNQRGSPSPRPTPPPPSGSPGPAMMQRTTPPPPPSRLSGPTGLPPTSGPYGGQDGSPAARSISSRRRIYPAQTSPPGVPGVPAGMMNLPNQASHPYPGQRSAMPQQQSSYGSSAHGLSPPFPSSGLEGPMGRLTVQQPSGCQPINLLEQRHILPTTPLEHTPPFLQPDLQRKNCSPGVLCSTLNAVPETKSLLSKSKLPLGIHLHPFKDLQNLPVIHSSVITRCRSCRTYINPFVTFTDSRRWRCPMCFRINDVPEEFCFDPTTRQYGDPAKRPEVRNATVEFIAPSEYMLRPPQPAVFLFVLDVSFNALETGYLHLICKLLKENLDKMPGDSRTQIGFITFDSTVHFYSLKSRLTQPQMYIVSDLDDVFLPSPEDLLVNLAESKELVVQLLESLPTMFTNCHIVHSATGSALQAALKLIGPTGGRITVFQTTLPNIGPGQLKKRDDGQKSSPKDVQNLSPATDFYKKFALDCAAEQVAVDIFLLSGQYADIATLMCASKYSGGSVMYYPDFHISRNPAAAEKLENEFVRYLTRKIGFEAVMRVRCTKGLSIHTFHGNFFVRSTDLVSLPNVSPDSGFSLQIDIEDSLTDSNIAVFQSALLYTSTKGERRIRVHTLALPITNKLAEVYAAADCQAITTLLAKMAVDRTLSSSLGDAREALMNACIDTLSVYRTSVANQPQSSGLLAPFSLRLLPLFILAIMKNMAFRLGSSTRLDERCFAMQQFKVMPLNLGMLSLYPRLYPIHDISDEGALHTKGGPVPQPPIYHLSGEKLSRKGIFLMDTGQAFYIWVGRDAPVDVIQAIFNVPNYGSIHENLASLPVVDTPYSERVRRLVDYLQSQRTCHSNIYVLKEDSRMRNLFLQNLVDDRSESVMSYYEFLVHIQKQVSK